MLVFARGKKTLSVNAATQKVVNQLSALSASRKQPKLLLLCAEDLVKHKAITNAWKIFTRKADHKRQQQLEKQFASIKQAMDEIEQASPELYSAALKPQKRFPLELRVPTQYPANQPWTYNFKRNEKA